MSDLRESIHHSLGLQEAKQVEAKDPVAWLKGSAWQGLRQRAGQIDSGKRTLPDEFKKANVEGDLKRIAATIEKSLKDLDKVISKVFK